jgi:hypothetical protein
MIGASQQTAMIPISVPSGKSDQYPINRLQEWSIETCLRFLELSETTQKKLNFKTGPKKSTAGDARKRVIGQVRALIAAKFTDIEVEPAPSIVIPLKYNMVDTCAILNIMLFIFKRLMPTIFDTMPLIRSESVAVFNEDLGRMTIFLQQAIHALFYPQPAPNAAAQVEK